MTAATDVDLSTPVDFPADAAPPLARTLRVNAEYRRSLLYIVIGAWAALALVVAIGPPPANPGSALAVVLIFGVGPTLFWIYASTYRLVIDDQGLSRRRLWFWSHWPWEDFLGGNVRLNEKDGFLTYSKRPIWDRWIMLAFLTPEDLPFLVELIRRTSPIETPPVVDALMPAVDELELNLFPFRKLQITRDGCTWLKTGELLLWSEIEEMRVERQRMKSQCLYRLQVTAKGRSFSGPITRLRREGSWCSPRDDVREAWLVQLRVLVPERCFAYYRTDGELASVQEGEFRLKHLEDTRRVMARFEWFGWALLPICAIGFGPRIPAAWNVPFLALGWKLGGVAACLFMIVQPTLMLVPLSRFVGANLREQQEKTKREMASLTDAAVISTAPAAVQAA